MKYKKNITNLGKFDNSKKENNKRNYIYIGIIFIVTVIILSSLFLNDRYEGHDTIFHVSNIIKLSETISFDSIFGDSIIKFEIDNFNYGLFGYGVRLFYPKIPHLFAAYIYLLLDDIYLSMNLIYFVTTFLSGIFVYFLSNKIYNNKNIALLSSIIYITIPYHICEIYIRDAIAENFMFMVLPMIFLGLYNLKEGKFLKFYILFSLGYIIGMNSHLVSMLYYTILIGIFILYYRDVFFKKDKIKALLFSAVIVTVMVLPSLVTLLEHKRLDLYRVFTPIFVDVIDVKSSVIEFSSLYNQEVIYNDIMTYFNMSSVILFVFSTILFLFNKNDRFRRDKKIFLLLMFIIINFMCSNIIWDYVPELFLSIQFPWRLLVFLSLMMSLYAPSFLVDIIDSKVNLKFVNGKVIEYLFKGVLLILILFIVYEGYGNIRYYRNKEISANDAMNSVFSLGFQKEYYPYIKPGVGLFSSDYFPDRDYNIVDISNDDSIIFNDNLNLDDDIENDNSNLKNDGMVIKIISDDFPSMEFEVIGAYNTVIELPRTFYLGYELIDQDGDLIKLECSKNGLLQGLIKEDGKYKLRYVGTKMNRIAKILRFIVIVVMLVVLVVKYRKWIRKRLQF